MTILELDALLIKKEVNQLFRIQQMLTFTLTRNQNMQYSGFIVTKVL